MIVDLDAHQGNGHENDHIDNPDVFIVDAYNHDIYPGDRAAKRAIGLDIALTHQTTDEGLLKKMEKIRD